MRNPPLQSTQPLPTPANIPDPVDQLLRHQSTEIIQTTHVRKFILLSLFLPPVGLFVAWKEKRIHLVLPPVLIAGSIIFGLSNLGLFFSLKPVLTLLKIDTSSLNLLNPVYTLLLLGTLVLFFVGISSGLYYKNEVKKEGNLTPKITWILLLIFSLQYVFGFILFAYVNSLLTPNLQSQYQNLQETKDFLSP